MGKRLPKLTLWRVLLVLACIGVLLSVSLVVRQTSPTQTGYERYHWQDTKYRDIRTKIVERSSNTYNSIVEYPMTHNDAVNATIAAKVESYNDEFFHANASCRSFSNKKCTQNTSYQIIRYANNYVSVAVTTVRDLGGAPTHDTAYWTFDLITGRVVTLRDIFSTYAVDGPARVVLYAKQAVMAKMQKSMGRVDMSRADAAMTPTRLDNFLAVDAHTIRFDFPPGEVAPDAIGQVTIMLPTDNLQLFMQNSTAQKVFAVIQLDTIPEYTTQSKSDAAINCESAKCVALTFDDGPSMYTSRLLDVLKSRKAHASFFLIGQNIARYPQIVQREHNEGHTIGNHTWSHPYLTHLDESKIREEIAATNAAVIRLTGQLPTYMRPPNGAIDSKVVQALADEHMTGMLWSVDTRDWADRNSALIYNRVVAGAKSGSIVILHDVHRPSVEAVPNIIDTLQKNGYTLVSLDELFGPNPAPGKIIRSSD